MSESSENENESESWIIADTEILREIEDLKKKLESLHLLVECQNENIESLRLDILRLKNKNIHSTYWDYIRGGMYVAKVGITMLPFIAPKLMFLLR
jgi:hypothetical protein